ncbi:MAG: hypothetical protein OXT71_17185 [Acidobacteriota bacterium]|nr:hypothetical protein [Acidobacteriota bacterium]
MNRLPPFVLKFMMVVFMLSFAWGSGCIAHGLFRHFGIPIPLSFLVLVLMNGSFFGILLNSSRDQLIN